MTQLPLNGATLGFEETLWSMADQMRGHMDPAEYKHVVLGLIFLKYISDAFSRHTGSGRHVGLPLRRTDRCWGGFCRGEPTCSPCNGADTGVPGRFYEDWTVEDNWHFNPVRVGGGALANAGLHGLDLALWLGAAPPVEVSALSDAAGAPVERFITIQARLANGVLLSLTSADMRVDSRRAAVYGDHGMLTGDTTGGGRIYLYHGGDAEEIEPKVGDVSACEAFVSAVTEGAPNLCPARDGAYAVALLEAAYRSAREGRMVRVERPQGW